MWYDLFYNARYLCVTTAATPAGIVVVLAWKHERNCKFRICERTFGAILFWEIAIFLPFRSFVRIPFTARLFSHTHTYVYFSCFSNSVPVCMTEAHTHWARESNEIHDHIISRNRLYLNILRQIIFYTQYCAVLCCAVPALQQSTLAGQERHWHKAGGEMKRKMWMEQHCMGATYACTLATTASHKGTLITKILLNIILIYGRLINVSQFAEHLPVCLYCVCKHSCRIHCRNNNNSYTNREAHAACHFSMPIYRFHAISLSVSCSMLFPTLDRSLCTQHNLYYMHTFSLFMPTTHNFIV